MKRGGPRQPDTIPDSLRDYVDGQTEDNFELQQKLRAIEEEKERQRQLEAEAERQERLRRDQPLIELRKLRRQVDDALKPGRCFGYAAAINFGGLFLVFWGVVLLSGPEGRGFFSLVAEFLCGSIGFGLLSIPVIGCIGLLVRHVWLKSIDARMANPDTARGSFVDDDERRAYLNAGPDWDGLAGGAVGLAFVGTIAAVFFSESLRWYHFFVWIIPAAMAAALLVGGVWAVYAYVRMRSWNERHPHNRLRWEDFKQASGLF